MNVSLFLFAPIKLYHKFFFSSDFSLYIFTLHVHIYSLKNSKTIPILSFESQKIIRSIEP
jgi:hypothetical protein